MNERMYDKFYNKFLQILFLLKDLKMINEKLLNLKLSQKTVESLIFHADENISSLIYYEPGTDLNRQDVGFFVNTRGLELGYTEKILVSDLKKYLKLLKESDHVYFKWLRNM